MPPEYIAVNKVSSKNDIFSLGVIIIEIVMGPTGYSKCPETPSEEFSEEFSDLVRNNPPPVQFISISHRLRVKHSI